MGESMSALDIIKQWPRYEDGKFVNFGDELFDFAHTIYKTVKTVQFNENGVVTLSNGGGSANITISLNPGERIKRHINTPIIAADGLPLREGEVVYEVDDKNGYPHIVISIELDDLGHVRTAVEQPNPANVSISPKQLTHERPESWELIEKDAEVLRQTIAVYLGDYEFDDSGDDTVQTRFINLVHRARKLGERR